MLSMSAQEHRLAWLHHPGCSPHYSFFAAAQVPFAAHSSQPFLPRTVGYVYPLSTCQFCRSPSSVTPAPNIRCNSRAKGFLPLLLSSLPWYCRAAPERRLSDDCMHYKIRLREPNIINRDYPRASLHQTCAVAEHFKSEHSEGET